jgi:hypothetical protein
MATERVFYRPTGTPIGEATQILLLRVSGPKDSRWAAQPEEWRREQTAKQYDRKSKSENQVKHRGGWR